MLISTKQDATTMCVRGAFAPKFKRTPLGALGPAQDLVRVRPLVHRKARKRQHGRQEGQQETRLLVRQARKDNHGADANEDNAPRKTVLENGESDGRRTCDEGTTGRRQQAPRGTKSGTR